jgi:hypothetical protein
LGIPGPRSMICLKTVVAHQQEFSTVDLQPVKNSSELRTPKRSVIMCQSALLSHRIQIQCCSSTNDFTAWKFHRNVLIATVQLLL